MMIPGQLGSTPASPLVEIAEKKRQLDAMKDEVTELHPLLRQVLPKLKGVVDVEYTHGPSEKGADFVVTKSDETLNQTVYVGVIAKMGTIKADHSDVERQISECVDLDRHIAGGKRKIYLNEIWVVSTGNITESAKERIHAKFKTQNISFIGGEKLIELVDRTTPYVWLNVGVEIGHYLARLIVRMSELDSQSNLLQVNGRGRFIEADVIERDLNQYDKSNRRKSKRANLKEEILQKKISVIQGEMGSGKSHLLRHLALHFASHDIYKISNWLPIFIDWRTFVDRHGGNVDSLIDAEVGASLGKLKAAEMKFLLFIDGIDELRPTSSDDIELIDTSPSVASLIDQAKVKANVKLVLASRPMAGVTALARNTSAGCFDLQPISLTKIISFVAEVCKELNLSKRLFDDLQKSDLFRQLPHTPIAAILLSKLLSENQKELPANLTELYAQSVEHMLGRWDISKGLTTQKEYEACEQICFRLANYLVDNNLPQIAIEEAYGIASAYLNERNLSLKAESIFDYLTKRSGMLAVNHEQRTVGFRHRSFAEFLYAKSKRSGSGMQIDQRAFQLYWFHIYFFYLGLWKDSPELLRELLGVTPQDEGQRWLKVMSMPKYFLAAFSTPYEVLEQNLYKLFVEAASLYEFVLSGKSASKLSNLSEMQLLWLMQILTRESYSYEYFHKAIDSVRVQIDDDISLSPTQRAAAQFFVAVTAMDLGEKKPFDFLIERNDIGSLPLSVSYAIMQESKSIEDEFHSTMLKKRNKKLRQLLAQNKGLSQQLKVKFDMSVLAVNAPQKKKVLPSPGKSGTAATRK